MMYYYEKLKFKLRMLLERSHRVDGAPKMPNLSLLEKLMSRCLKLYRMIDDFMKIFKLITMKERMDLARHPDPLFADAKEERKRQILIKRLTVAIWLLLRENPFLPFSFNFKGECLLLHLKGEREKYVARR